MILNNEPDKAQFRFAEKVIKKTIGEIRTFLDELANGTSNYKSLHNLTEQVEHQYHGRFLIELIQNAHDALFDIPKQRDYDDNISEDEGRIEIVISDEPPFGALYVANDGSPFTESNFENLSRFGQSDKDPEKHIGNKGIGFRSVLEITREPEIYSRKEISSTSFNGFTFCFTPRIIRSFEQPIHDLLNGHNSPKLELASDTHLVEWGSEKLQAFQDRFQFDGFEGVVSELKFLSPYLLPVPISAENKMAMVRQFEEKGFATVVRLPFSSEEAKRLTIEKVEELDENTILFLNKAKSLWIETPTNIRYVTRKTQSLTDLGNAQQIDIGVLLDENNYANTKRYWLWEWIVGGKEYPQESEKIREAVSNLPGKWPDVRRAEVALAISVEEPPDQGLISIFLPTEQPSGAACHLNAPFYGDISRTYVDFDQPFNKLLIEKMAKKATDIISMYLAGKGIYEARAIQDILCPLTLQDSDDNHWLSLIEAAFEDRDQKLEEEPLILTNNGWNVIGKARLLPDCSATELISDEIIYKEATYPVIDKSLSSRLNQLKNLYIFFRKPYSPQPDWIAATLEKIAAYFHREFESVDWNGFWHDVMELLPKQASMLQGKKILLGTDGELHATGKNMSVFFRPRSTGDDEEILPNRAVDDIPQELRSYIAFLNEAINVHVHREGGGIRNHPLHGYLASSSLVQPFGVESILRNVLIPATPDLPVSLNKEKDSLCRGIISWGLRLVEGLVAKDKGEKTLQYLGRLPAPCHGGWYPLSETCFGPGWDDTVGRELKSYLDAARTIETKESAKKLLLPPYDEHWSNNVPANRKLLERAGAIDGIRLFENNPEDWAPSFQVTRWNGVRLPEKAPPGIDSEIWKRFIDKVHSNLKPRYDGPFPFKVDNFFVIPGTERFSSLSLDERENFMNVLLRSIVKWVVSWETIWISKIGGMIDSMPHESPLKHWLKETPWLVDREKTPPEFRPKDRWFIPPKTIVGRAHQFRHLNPVPSKISWFLDESLELSKELENLGMPRYHPENKTSSTRLLDDLSLSLENPEEIANWDIFLGQVRSAWSLFEPQEEGAFPQNLIVKRGSGLQAITPSVENPVFLPDDTSSFHHGLESYVKNILAIESKDAKRLGMIFRKAFGRGVRFISELRVQPLVDGDPWEEGLIEEFFCESDLSWIIPILLCCHAHAGIQDRGAHTKAFSNVMEGIRKARLYWADNLEIGIWEKDQCVPVSKIDGVWLTKSFTLLATHKAREKVSVLAEAFSSMMERSDLEVPLKLALSKFDGYDDPTREIIEGALKELKIDFEHIAEIEQLWLGDLGWSIRLLRPLLLVLHPKLDFSGLTEISTEDALKQFLLNFNLSPLNLDQALSKVRKSDGFYNLGLSLYESFGDAFQLGQWNIALKMAGESTIKNREASDQFQNNIDSAQVPLRSIVREIVKNNKEIGQYTDLIEQLELMSVPEDQKNLYWDINFNQTMEIIKPLFISWEATSEAIEAITASQNVSELIEKLEALNFDPTLDPVEIYAKNRVRCLILIQTIQKAGIIWCYRNDTPLAFWDRDTTDYLEFYDDILKDVGYLDIWNDEMIFSISKNLPYDEQMKPFFDALSESKNIDNFLELVDIRSEEIDNAEKKLEEIKNKAEKQKRIVNVCGKDFDNTEDNLSQLFSHIEGEIENDSLPDVDLTDMARLNEIKQKRSKRPGIPTKKRQSKPKGRMTQAMKNLVGLAGEIHAYRVLRKKYGPIIVNPGSWISENSTFKFPNNSVADDYGCDFKIRHNKNIFFIEVKASQGDEEVFELGVSEIKRAVEVANKRKERYIIFHITDALSNNPKFQFLPNPYDRRYSKSYRIFNAGLKIQYQKKL